MARNYEHAIACLNSRKTRPQASLDDMRGSDDMMSWINIIGYLDEDLNSLNIVHVSGTDGKGSTCAFIASILRASGKKVGLYTSPHLQNVRERIRIDGQPIPEAMWADRFFDIWDKLPRQATADLDIPRYLQLLTLLSFHVFLKEGVDVAVYETHMGGRYDATNVIPSPVITAVTHVARDHIQYLGPDIETISWHKAGIIKQGTVVFSSIQEQAVVKVLQREASEKGVPITFVDKDHQLPVTTEFQRENCSLAVAVARSWLRIKGTGELAENSILEGVKLFDWPGRYQIIYRDKYQWFLDGAHNESSLPYAVQWFATACKAQSGSPNVTRILIFSHSSKRDRIKLLQVLQRAFDSVDIRLEHVIFTTYKERRDEDSRPLCDVLEPFQTTWKEHDHNNAKVWCEETIEDALQRTLDINGPEDMFQILVTGSLHLIGGVLSCLKD